MCNNFLQILKGLLSLARSVEITTDPDQEVVPACDLLRGNATCYVDIVITPPRVHIGLLHCVHIVITQPRVHIGVWHCVDIVITLPRVHIGLWHCVHIVILPLPLVLIYCMNIGNLCSYIYNPQGNASI